nr:MAG TPA: hypothetical protein [Caudoviricetes sp.]
MNNTKYTVHCELYKDTDKEFKFHVFLNETGVIAFAYGLITLRVTYDKVTKRHTIEIDHCEEDNLLTSSEVVGVVGPAIDGYIKYILSGKRGAMKYYRDYIDDYKNYFISWVNARIESINNDENAGAELVN